MVQFGTVPDFSRAEVSDASMGVSAECVMLNKGPYTVEAVHFLDNILRCMQLHHRKKGSLLPGPIGFQNASGHQAGTGG